MAKGLGHITLFCMLMLAPIVYAGQAVQEQAVYRLGVLPFVDPETIEARYGSLAVDLGKALEGRVHLRTRTSFKTYSDALAQKEFDIALVQPFDYVDAADRGDYVPLARISRSLSTILVVPNDSPIHQTRELKGATIALPPETAAVSMVAGPMFRRAGLVPDEDVHFNHTRGHDTCLMAVRQDRADACVTARIALNVFSREHGEFFRVLDESGPIPHVVFVVREDFPLAERDKVLSVLTRWHENGYGREWLSDEVGPVSLVSARDSDYDAVRRLRDSNRAR